MGRTSKIAKIIDAVAHGQSMKALNNAIDILGLRKEYDLTLHFLNEAVIHRDPNMFMRNFARYEVEPWLRRQRRKK